MLAGGWYAPDDVSADLINLEDAEDIVLERWPEGGLHPCFCG